MANHRNDSLCYRALGKKGDYAVATMCARSSAIIESAAKDASCSRLLQSDSELFFSEERESGIMDFMLFILQGTLRAAG